MKTANGLTGLIAIPLIALCASRPGLADDRYVLHYDHPIAASLKRLDHSMPRPQINARFMGQALPLGNGRFGAMFSGHVDSEYMVFNDFTLWMNSTHGESEFKQAVRIVAGDAEVEARANGTLQISGASEVILYVAGYTDYLPQYPEFKGRDFEGDTLRALQQAEVLGYMALKRNHVVDVQSLMQRVHLDLGVAPSGLPTDRLVREGDPREVQKLYFDYARYLQICSSPDAPMPSNLQGLWNTLLVPPWQSDYHTDINVQKDYWMVETANLPESFSPFVQWTKVLAESGRHAAWGTFEVKNGWTIGLNGNIFGFTGQNIHGRRLQQGSHWLAQRLFEHYAFSKDRVYLEEAYPVLKGAAEFFVEHLAPWKDGQLVQATIHAKRDGAFRIHDQGKLSEVISLKQGQSKVWPGTN